MNEQQRITQLQSMEYSEYLKTPEWAARREQVVERDAYCCRVCNSDKKLEVHHRTYQRRGNEDLNDLTTLCEECHEDFHRRIRQAELMVRTYTPPRPDWKASPLQEWEDVLVGMLIVEPDLLSHVRVVLSEEDFTGEETRALYQLLTSRNTLLQVDQPFEKAVPAELMSVVARCKKSLVFGMTMAKPDQIQTVIQAAMRLKRYRLTKENENLKGLLDAAYKSGDTAEMRRLMTQSHEANNQMRVIDNATHPRKARNNDE